MAISPWLDGDPPVEAGGALVGRTLIGSGSNYHSPWQAARGNSARFTIETIAIGASTTFDVTVQTKNRNETDAQAAAVDDIPSITSTGISAVNGSGVKELVRLKYTVGGAGSMRFVHFRWLEVAWS
jgi:hypothetical protein